MKAVLARDFARADGQEDLDATLKRVLVVDDNVGIPALGEKNVKEMIVKVRACSLSPGDWRRLNGSMDFVATPKFPYVPGHDLCGIVTEANEGCGFKVGDRIAVNSSKVLMQGGLAEFARVECQTAAIVPEGVSDSDAASIPTSGARAYETILERGVVKKGDRVLILGGSGGIGHMLVQLAKEVGASFVACTCTQKEMMHSLGADLVIDYRTENFWDVDQLKKDKLDVIIDCAQGLEAWKKCGPVLKSGYRGGCFFAMCMDYPHMKVHNIFNVLYLIRTIALRPLLFKMLPMYPRNVTGLFGPNQKSCNGALQLVQQGKLRIVNACTLPMTSEGVCQAMGLVASFHAHGKIVVQIDKQ